MKVLYIRPTGYPDEFSTLITRPIGVPVNFNSRHSDVPSLLFSKQLGVFAGR
jgi:hypothetical protein